MPPAMPPASGLTDGMPPRTNRHHRGERCYTRSASESTRSRRSVRILELVHDGLRDAAGWVHHPLRRLDQIDDRTAALLARRGINTLKEAPLGRGLPALGGAGA